MHDGTGAIDQFKPMKMIEIKDLHELKGSLPSSTITKLRTLRKIGFHRSSSPKKKGRRIKLE